VRTEDPEKDVNEEMDVHAALQQHGDRGQEDGDDQQEQIGCPKRQSQSHFSSKEDVVGVAKVLRAQLLIVSCHLLRCCCSLRLTKKKRKESSGREQWRSFTCK
jgi:hypothetical protein